MRDIKCVNETCVMDNIKVNNQYGGGGGSTGLTPADEEYLLPFRGSVDTFSAKKPKQKPKAKSVKQVGKGKIAVRIKNPSKVKGSRIKKAKQKAIKKKKPQKKTKKA